MNFHRCEKILIAGYGNIGKHIRRELSGLPVELYDPKITTKCENRVFTLDALYDIAFVCVPTELSATGECDTSVVEKIVSEINARVIVIKSTVPPHTTDSLKAKCGKNIVFSPETYGTTQHCVPSPNFVILGGDRTSCDAVADLYNKTKNGYFRFYFTDTVTAELSKYMLNSFLALKVTFCNEFADIAKEYGVSYPELRELFIADERISPSHTIVYPCKPFYDSHCFNKDVPAFLSFAKNSELMKAVYKINKNRKSEGV